ncbi:MAG: VWA domain-containing protein, partial [Lentisphaerae bacterium]|nr:VWA domain-containing protein [Lentisphaerota bacterium]
DRVSLHVFDEDIRDFIPPGSTQRHLQNLMHVLERNQPGRKTSVANALRRAFPLLNQRGVLVVISDFFDNAAEIFSALNPYLHRGFSVYLCHVLAPEELELPDRGLVTFRDMETQRRVVAHTGSLRPHYREAIRSHIKALRELAMRRHVDYVVARTDASFYHLFDRFTS